MRKPLLQSMIRIILLQIAALYTLVGFSQDYIFTQKTNDLNSFNPSLVGTQSDMGVQLNYYNQWPQLDNNPILMSMLTNYNLKNGLGIGLAYCTELFGLTKENKVKTNVNYALNTGDIELKVGTSLGFNQQSFDVNRINTPVGPDPNLTGNNTGRYFSLDIGAAAYYHGFVAGVSSYQLNKPSYKMFSSTYNVNASYNGFVGYSKKLKDIRISGLIAFQQISKLSSLDYHISGQYKFVKLGLGLHSYYGAYGNTDYISASSGVIFDQFSVAYSYASDPFSRPNNLTARGTHHATVAWFFKGLKKESGLSDFVNGML